MDPPFDQLCVSSRLPVSVIVLASSYGDLAAILCGLTFGAVAFILGRKEGAPPHSVALLSANVLILAADSFLFANVESRRPPVVDGVVPASAEYVCYLSWTLVMSGVGMLMVGATILVASVGWMIIQYAAVNGIDSRIFATLGGIFTAFVVLTTTVSLINNSRQYLSIMMYPRHPPPWATAGIWVFSASMTAIGCGLIATRTIGLCRYRRHNTDWGPILDSRFTALAIASFFTAGYGFLAIVVDAVILFVRSGDAVRGAGVMWAATLLCLVFPWAIYLPVCASVPGMRLRRSRARAGSAEA